MEQLLPPGGAADVRTLTGLAEAYAYPPREAGAYVRANMVASLDGAAYHEERSAGLSSPADMRLFGTLRALADVVIVGAETVRREGYGPAKARAVFAERRAADGQTPAPAIAVASRALDLDFGSPLFTEAPVPTLVLTGAGADPSRLAAARQAGVHVVIAGEGEGADPLRAVAELAALGHARLLHEGGPRLLAQFAAAGVLDELCLTIAPLLAGGGAPRIMNGPPVTNPGGEGPAPFVPVSVLTEGGFFFTRYAKVAA